jgi:hypothetical protein
MNGRRSGRIDLAWLLAAGFAGALLGVVLLGRTSEHEASRRAEEPHPGLQPSSAELSALANALDKLDQRLARIEASLAETGARGSRTPVNPPAAADGQAVSVSSTPTNLGELHEDMLRMSKRIDTLAESLLENRRPSAQYPTLEQMHSARADVDWNFVEEVRRACLANPNAALERVQLMTFDDLLKKVGLPTGIRADDGVWWYSRPATDSRGQSTNRGIVLHFIRDYVTSVEASGID